jgi:hypothetical protein
MPDKLNTNANDQLSRLGEVIKRLVLLEQESSKDSTEEAQNYFVQANPNDIEAIKQRFKLPSTYLEFLNRFSPTNFSFSFGGLYTAAELLEENSSWLPYFTNPSSIVVIGSAMGLGDPMFLRLDLSDGTDAPVFSVMHDCWDEESPMEWADSFLELLELEVQVLEEIAQNP